MWSQFFAYIEWLSIIYAKNFREGGKGWQRWAATVCTDRLQRHLCTLLLHFQLLLPVKYQRLYDFLKIRLVIRKHLLMSVAINVHNGKSYGKHDLWTESKAGRLISPATLQIITEHHIPSIIKTCQALNASCV